MISIFWYCHLPHLPSCPTKSSRERTAGGVVTSSRTEACCATTRPLRAGSVCALAPRLSALVGNNTHAHPTCKSDSVVVSFPGLRVCVSASWLCIHSLIRVKVGHHDTATSIIARSKPPSSYVVVWLAFQGYRGRFAMSVGRDRAFSGRVMDASHVHTPARADRVPAIWDRETELVRLRQ